VNIKNKFVKDGYVVVPKVLNTKEINYIKKISSKIFGKFYKKKKNWDSLSFNRYLAQIRKKTPENFSYFYNTLQSNINLKKIASNKKVINNIKNILKIDDSNVSHSICNMRIDSFIDQRNSYDWHQERSYYPMNEDGNGIFVWIALSKISNNIGPLHALRGSHKEGFVIPSTSKKKNHSIQHKIPNQIIDKYKSNVEVFNINAGDAIFMHMNTFHKSGKNKSNKFRLSIVARYHDNSKDDFRPFFDTGNYFYSRIKNSEFKSF